MQFKLIPEYIHQYSIFCFCGWLDVAGPFHISGQTNLSLKTAFKIWTYTWNGENRLITIENFDMKLEFAYDYLGRLTHMW